MKNHAQLILALAALAVLSIPQVSGADMPATDPAAEKAIRQLEEDWGRALVNADKAALDRITAPDWVLCDPAGHMSTKAQAEGDVISGAMKFETFKTEELQIRVYGNTAIAFGTETEKSSYKGKDTSGRYRFTDVFVKRDGRWQAVATHVSKVVGE